MDAVQEDLSIEVTQFNPILAQGRRLAASEKCGNCVSPNQFKTQWRWLKQHPEALAVLKCETVPDRSTLSRRYKALYRVLHAFSAFLGQNSELLGAEMSTKHPQ